MWPFSTISTQSKDDVSTSDAAAAGNGVLLDEKSNDNNVCQLKCPMEQKALVSCVDSIRAARASSDDGGEGMASAEKAVTTTTPACLLPAVEAWTKCCSEANQAFS
jgi:hypothetical protein